MSRPQPRSVASHDHTPIHPSGLRQSHTAASYESLDQARNPRDSPELSPRSPPVPGHGDNIPPMTLAGPSNRHSAEATETTALLGDTLLGMGEQAHEGPCNHGTFSPRPMSPTDSITADSHIHSESESDGLPAIDGTLSADARKKRRDWKKQLASKMKSKKMSTSSILAQRHGISDSALMYLSYYLPVLVWARQYNWEYFKGDFVAALTVAGMYLPMALSLADNLAHVPAINGLYSFVFNPLVYAVLGSCPSMIVGPEAAGSLLVGTVIKSSVDSGHGGDDDAVLQATICGVVAGMAGAMVFVAGIARLGFLDGVLSRPFLRGFISAIGVVITVDQLIPELGLNRVIERSPGVSHGSSVDKLRFIFGNLDKVHGLTFAIAGSSFAIIMICREVKRRLQPKYPGVAYIPDRFIVVVVSAILAYMFDWEGSGVAVLGKVESASGHLFTFRWPFRPSHMPYIRDAMGTSFLIALLGFFESSVAAKSIGGNEAFSSIQLSPNRELVALGTANLVGACFMSLPAFGGYGRSKVNKSTGGKSPMSSIILSLLTLVCILFLLPYFYYLPKPVLCSLISVVAWSLIEECPHDVLFFVRIGAWQELALMATILLATIFYSLTLGMAIGVGLSLLQVIRHSTRPRIQILGRIPGTNRFENAEANPDRLEFIEGCLIVKIPEPLTFANTGELKTRLRRMELYGTNQAHPALPRLRREDSNRNIIFDIHGVTSLDGSGTQVLEEIVRDYRQRGVRIFFSRVPSRDSEVWELLDRSGIIELAGGEDHFVEDVHEALKLTEVESDVHV
ncbi:sulfate transporter family-domain-containing protein [Echria macrotheca]|uniref:Sulfate transporter family-domain-containing protein n=1 Tax=Echria macrotheca TaxID=438768 RepID=A0AAJ0B5I4_9PEZI|nr:sulfate transporter family-domain-containing protein [Echria macrotheca]